ncbi:MAG TPA: amino acid adenylation domain-containing protein [Micromonosporaceae bacterium]
MELIADHPRTLASGVARGRSVVPAVEPLPGTGAVHLLAAYAVLLYKYTGEPDLLLAVDLAGRGRGELRLVVEPGLPFAGLVARAAEAVVTPAGPGPFPLGFTDHREVAESATSADGTDITLRVWPDGTGWRAEFDYAQALFDPDSMQRLGRHLVRVLTTAAEPGLTVGAIDLVDEAERVLVRDGFNATTTRYPREATIHELFRQQARQAPDRLAVRAGSRGLTYRELDARSDRMARRLLRAGVRAGEPVGLMLARDCPDMVVATLAILKAGGAYLPVDTGYPPQRAEFLLTDSGARVLVTDTAQVLPFAFPGAVVRVGPAGGADHGDDDGDDHSVERPALAEDPAYVIYTSGTTGRPKGVLVTHRGVVRLVCGNDYLAFTPDTRMLAISSICFDAATFELWAPLLNGGSVHLAPNDVALSASALRRELVEHDITTMLLIAPVFNHLVDQDPTVLARLRQLVVGGDALSPHHIGVVLDTCPELELVNGYGPTENATLATTHRLRRADLARIPIGRPVANSTAYVMNADDQLCPVGVPGELCVGGDGVALGYLHRPELSGRRFRPDPFRPGGRLYRTGDIARWRPDGVLDFFGRRDDQVKVRGFRIELGEIEHVLLDHAAVREAVVVAPARPGGGDRYLCAYYVGQATPDEVRDHLRHRVPDHLLPSFVVELPALPLNASGKVDRARLPAPPASATVDSRPGARDELEATLATLVARALGQGAVGVHDDLRDRGADSFTAAVVASGIEAELAVRVPVREVLRSGTVARIADLVRAAAPGPLSPAVPRAADQPSYPVSPQQRRLYVEQLKYLGSVHYNVPILVDFGIGVALDEPRLRAALAVLAGRHESLRTAFTVEDGQLRQRVATDVEPVLSTVADPPADVTDLVRPFELDQPPLWRAVRWRGPQGDQLLLDLHHLITDGVSAAVLVEELALAYAGLALPPLPAVRYRDYATWLTGPDGSAWAAAGAAYWRGALGGRPPQPDLPLDAPRPAMRALDGAVAEFTVAGERLAALRRLARREGVTLFAALAAGYTAVLAGWSAAAEVSVGTPVAGRSLPGLDRVLGMFANTVCLRVHADPGLTFTAHLHQVAAVAEQAAAHQDYPVDDLVADLAPQRDYRRNPLFDAFIALHSRRYLQVEVAGRRVALRPQWNGQATFDLNLQLYEETDHLRASWQYGSRLLSRTTMLARRDDFLAVLDAVLADPEIQLGQLPITSSAPTERTAAQAWTAVPALDFDLS